MVRFVFTNVLAVLTVLSVLSLDARLARVRADDVTDCIKGSGDTKIRGCSRLIESRRLFGKPISTGNLANAYYDRGLAYTMNGECDRAMADYNKAIKFNPKFANAYNYRGVAYYTKGLYDRAITDFDTAIKLNPKNASFYVNRATVYEEIEQYEKAITDYQKALELEPFFQGVEDDINRLGVAI